MKTKAIRLLLIAVTLLSSGNMHAQNAEQARRILDKTAATVGNKGGASANFAVEGGSFGRTSGRITIKGRRFTVATPRVKVWYDGRNQWTYMSATNEVNLSYPTETQRASMNPYSFLSMYRSGYRLSMKTVNATYHVHLQSTSRTRNIQQIDLVIGRNYLPRTVRLLQGKRWIKITLSNFRLRDLPDSFFTFPHREYPHAELVDLR